MSQLNQAHGLSGHGSSFNVTRWNPHGGSYSQSVAMASQEANPDRVDVDDRGMLIRRIDTEQTTETNKQTSLPHHIDATVNGPSSLDQHTQQTSLQHERMSNHQIANTDKQFAKSPTGMMKAVREFSGSGLPPKSRPMTSGEFSNSANRQSRDKKDPLLDTQQMNTEESEKFGYSGVVNPTSFQLPKEETAETNFQYEPRSAQSAFQQQNLTNDYTDSYLQREDVRPKTSADSNAHFGQGL